MARLSEIISNTKYLDHLEISLYHGTNTYYLEYFKEHGIRRIDTEKPRDFGTGFYLTTNYWQALDYAKNYSISTYDPMVVCCFITLGDLRSFANHLLIDDYNDQWLETIVRGRCCDQDKPLHQEYDWIYGRCGDGKTYIFNRKLKECNDDHEKLLEIIQPSMLTPVQTFPHYEYDQLWVGSDEVIKKLKNTHIIYKKGVEEIEFTIPVQQ
ncbi:DUF3990 domain-containing protein [Bacillus mycoides]|uniref:DUF3990 domain-containing protein n=1 Tax=Bacillus mycoides TaxID=1405 RepID=UPI000871EB96|nr:DUF3990 domain-containing protein [Bacillus mycoides]OFD56109.1 hypothetical protein BWGOE7_56140 [Bacillus mycoides]OFD87191.1 hypothetical protein BWGOE12_57670 [Bacillus mycoides]